MRFKYLLIWVIINAILIYLPGIAGENNTIEFIAISHASFVIEYEDKTIYVDPVGEIEDYKEIAKPDLILITDIHGDHLNTETITSLRKEKTIIISPQAVYDKLKNGLILNNFEKKEIMNIEIEALPMYNLSEERLMFHPKGRGNGYLLTIDDKRIYISGDTEDIPEMRALKNIDYAFICMNLPYTMTEEQAASATLEIKPGVVFPYHYRGKGGMSDIGKFIELVSVDSSIKVQLLDWYK